jgi:hypothetical protein
MSATSWSNLETFTAPPASTSTASSGDDYFRSFMSSIATGLATSFNWPGSGGGSLASAGVSLLGNARAARAGNSAVTGGYGDGFLLLNQAHISLHHIGSTWTGVLGHSGMVDHGGSIGSAPFTAHWLTQSGTFSLTSSLATIGSNGTIAIAFPTPYGAAPPYVQLTVNSNGGYWVNLSSITSGGFISQFSGLIAAIPVTTVTWESDGTVLN